MLTELENIRWDAILVNETWRTIKKELWVTQSKHVFAGSGFETNTRGVAILLHRLWTKQIEKFEAINERLAYIDVCNTIVPRLRLITAYFPHSGYADFHVQQLYTAIENVKQEGARKKRDIICGR
eukprot:7092683-Karenia_brevis.AAC.2